MGCERLPCSSSYEIRTILQKVLRNRALLSRYITIALPQANQNTVANKKRPGMNRPLNGHIWWLSLYGNLSRTNQDVLDFGRLKSNDAPVIRIPFPQRPRLE